MIAPYTPLQGRDYRSIEKSSITPPLRYSSKFDTDLIPPSHDHPWLDKLALYGSIPYAFISTILLLSPLLSKVAAKQLIKKEATQLKPWVYSALNKMQNRETFENTLWSILGALGLLTLIANYEIGHNTKQPSKQVGNLIWVTNMAGSIFQPTSIFFRSLAYLGTVFYYTGERNDIENFNHLEKRREWDRRQNSWKTLPAFLMRDLRETFSLKHWKTLFKSGLTAQGWQTPQSYQTALGVQLTAFTFLLSSLSILSQHKVPKLSSKLNQINPIFGILGSLFPSIPMAVRAWQSKNELDSQLIINGTPIWAIGRGFVTSTKYSFLIGLAGVGNLFRTQGIRLTSEKTNVFVSTIKQLHQQALSHPELTAQSMFTQITSHPETYKHLQKHMGKQRFREFIAILQQGAKQPNTPFAQYLYPMTISY